MPVHILRRAGAAALVALLAAAPQPTLAVAGDYEFRLVEPVAKAGDAVAVAFRLLDKRNGAAVRDAVIFARRIDMAPDGMPTMTAPLEPQPSNEPDVYRFTAKLGMEGNWRLSLAAKVQGEAETVVGALTLEVAP